MNNHSLPQKRPRIQLQAALFWPPLKIGRRASRAEAGEHTLLTFKLALQEGAEGIALDAEFCPDVLPWVRVQNCMAFITINSSTPDAEAMVVREINRAKVRHLVRVISPDLAGLRRIRQLDAKIHLGLHIGGRLPAILQAKALGAEVLLPRWDAASPSFIRRAHRASMLVIPWTVDSPRQMWRTILKGADGIITNYPAKLTQTVTRLQKKRPVIY